MQRGPCLRVSSENATTDQKERCVPNHLLEARWPQVGTPVVLAGSLALMPELSVRLIAPYVRYFSISRSLSAQVDDCYTGTASSRLAGASCSLSLETLVLTV